MAPAPREVAGPLRGQGAPAESIPHRSAAAGVGPENPCLLPVLPLEVRPPSSPEA